MKVLAKILCWVGFLLSWQNGYAATVGSSASGWIDLSGTQFYATPEGLCPTGTVTYEGTMYAITCSNNWRITGVLAFVCPANYLPSGYPYAWWQSSFTASSGYGVDANGIVPMGVGWGGSESCYSILPDLKPLLSLIGSAETRPMGISGYSEFSLLATVTKDGAPMAGTQVGFAVSVTPNSGSHEHHD
ncbi:MAG: hypothetical protein Q8R49_01320, partial [Rhodoferax sp.]|nr:hypothetical protein [Rhodoferax sp.]